MAFTTKDPKDTYLAILNLGYANEVLHATTPKVVLDAAGNSSLLELSQSSVEFTGIMTADVASGIVMDTGIDLTSDAVITDILKDKTDNAVGIHFTAGDPEGSLTASVGSLALRRDGSAGATLYVKETGTGNTGWSTYDLIATFLDLTDTPGTYTADKWLKVNAGGTAIEWVDAPPTDFPDLADTPANYSGAGTQSVRVNAGATALEFVDSDFLSLTDTLSSYTGYGFIAVNGGGTALVEILASAVQGDVIYRGASGWSNLGPGSDGDVLTTHGAAANPTWTTISGSGLPGSVQGAVTYYNGSNWVALTPGTSGQYLKTQGSGANPVWDNVDAFPASPNQGEIVYYNGSAWVNLSVGTTGQFLKTQGAAANPIWSDVAGAFTGLTDTPANYTSAANKLVVVNGTPDALVFLASTQGAVLQGDASGGWTALSFGTEGELLRAGSGGSVEWGSTSFLDLSDTPSDYGGEGLSFIAVNTGESDFEFCCGGPSDGDQPMYNSSSGNWENEWRPRFYSGTGSPESSVTAEVGSIYIKTDGDETDVLYVKGTGTGNTGWALVTSTAV
jgi:hypothetical protein